MKRLYTCLIYICLITTGYRVSAQQVIITDSAKYTTPAAGAVLDVTSSSKGFLPPRIALNSLTDVTTVPSRTNGLMVYNTGTGTLTDKGMYFWQDSVWVKALAGGNGATSYLKISNDGTVTLEGDATAYTDLVVNPAMAKNSGGTVPTWTIFIDSVYTWSFADAKDQEVDFTVQMPHNWKEGSTIYPHVHWSSIVAAGTTRVKWMLRYQWVNINDSFVPGATQTAYGSSIVNGDASTNLTAYQHIITPLSSNGTNAGIDATGKKLSSILVCRLYRNGSVTTAGVDDFTNSAFLLSFDFHYQIDSFGSSTQYTK